MPREITNKTPLTISEAREFLILRSEVDELSYLQRGALEHAHITAKVSVEIAKELTQIFISRYKIDLKNAITIINILPNNLDELRQLLTDTIKYPTELIEDMLELIGKIENEEPIPEKFHIPFAENEPQKIEKSEENEIETDSSDGDKDEVPDWFDDVDDESDDYE